MNSQNSYSTNYNNQNQQNEYNNQNNNNLSNMSMSDYTYTDNILINPILIFILVFVVIVYLILFFSLGDSDSSNSDNNEYDSNVGFKIITIVIIFLFIFLLALNLMQYYFGVNILTSIKNLFSNQPEIDITVIHPSSNSTSLSSGTVPEIKLNKQVFNIPGNNYNFSDAKALCTAYGADLANYTQIENAYDNGAEWCNYGWSDGQMALFPTQQNTFDKLQKIQGHENDCGRPGINGGIMANPELKFGVNCYGHKPVMTNNEEELMHEVPIYPRTMKDIAMEERVNYWKKQIPNILLSPFNHNNWSKI
jgi:hypothetical protein